MTRKWNFVICFLFPLLTWASGTVVRDGGDPLFYFLESTRDSLVDTLKLIKLDNNESAHFCTIGKLNAAQKKFCRQFFFAIVDQMLQLNQGEQKTLFVLRDKPLYVTGPDGKPMPVAAMTQLGPQGEVEFHRDSIKVMPPAQILFLMAHEFQHKSNYKNHYTTDNEVIGPFRNGRELIDTVAASVVEVAKRKGIIGTDYGLRDLFDCQIQVGGYTFKDLVNTTRMFKSTDMMSYETGIGLNPNDGCPKISENTNSTLYFKVNIEELGNCNDEPKYASTRSTRVQIIRSFAKDNSGNQPPDQIVNEDAIASFNPLCIVDGGTMTLSYQNVQFSCHYYGTQGSANISRAPAP